MIKNTIIFLMGLPGVGKRTIGEAMTKLDPQFTLIHNHLWMDPILKIVKNYSPWVCFEEPIRFMLKQSRMIVFETIATLAPSDANFIITSPILAVKVKNSIPTSSEVFDEVITLSNKRNATLIPVRLICNNIQELLKRGTAIERASFSQFKAVNPEILKIWYEHEIFTSNMPNELTLDVSLLKSEIAASQIIQWVKAKRGISGHPSSE